MQQQEIERLEKQFDETKAEDVMKYRNEINDEKEKAIRIAQEEKQQAINSVQDTIKELNETKLIKDEDMDAIKYELDITKTEIEEARVAINKLMNNEENSTKIIQMNNIINSLQNTKGKISFTQIQIIENEITRPMNIRAPRSEEHVPVEIDWEEAIWTEEVINKISKLCSKVKNEDICICSNKITREVYKC